MIRSCQVRSSILVFPYDLDLLISLEQSVLAGRASIAIYLLAVWLRDQLSVRLNPLNLPIGHPADVVGVHSLVALGEQTWELSIAYACIVQILLYHYQRLRLIVL